MDTVEESRKHILDERQRLSNNGNESMSRDFKNVCTHINTESRYKNNRSNKD